IVPSVISTLAFAIGARPVPSISVPPRTSMLSALACVTQQSNSPNRLVTSILRLIAILGSAVFSSPFFARTRSRVLLLAPPLRDLGACGHPDLRRGLGIANRLDDCLRSDRTSHDLRVNRR